jgi:hypothetical protein
MTSIVPYPTDSYHTKKQKMVTDVELNQKAVDAIRRRLHGVCIDTLYIDVTGATPEQIQRVETFYDLEKRREFPIGDKVFFTYFRRSDHAEQRSKSLLFMIFIFAISVYLELIGDAIGVVLLFLYYLSFYIL